jgi:hypothetical protein
MTHDEAVVREDWLDILRRPGMNVLATFLTSQLGHARSELENPSLTSSYDRVCEIRGEMRGFRKVIQYIKKEYDGAAKGDTPEKE